MKHILKLALLVFAAVVYSCHSDSKKQAGDAVEKSKMRTTADIVKNIIKEKNRPIETKLIFSKFIIKLHDFCVYIGNDGTSKSDFNGDSSKASINIDEHKLWNITAKTDTLPLPGLLWYYTNLIELIPEDKTETFKISYSLPAYIVEYNNDKAALLEVMNVYKPLRDSLNYFFRIPQSAYDNSNIGEVKKNLKLKDTIIRDKAADGKFYTNKLVIYKNKIYRMGSEGRVYLKTEQFNGNKLIETKFLIIAPPDSEDAD